MAVDNKINKGTISKREATKKYSSRTIVGTAIVFNSESSLLDDGGELFREVILPEAVTMDFLLTQDIKMNLLHQRELTVARWDKGKGSLHLSVDKNGVHFSFEAPRCDIGDRALEMVRSGVYSGCSFEFWPKDYKVNMKGKNGKTETLIEHRKFEVIGALTIGLDPAYTQTKVSVSEGEEEDKKEQKERECAAVMKMRRMKVALMNNEEILNNI